MVVVEVEQQTMLQEIQKILQEQDSWLDQELELCEQVRLQFVLEVPVKVLVQGVQEL